MCRGLGGPSQHKASDDFCMGLRAVELLPLGSRNLIGLACLVAASLTYAGHAEAWHPFQCLRRAHRRGGKGCKGHRAANFYSREKECLHQLGSGRSSCGQYQNLCAKSGPPSIWSVGRGGPGQLLATVVTLQKIGPRAFSVAGLLQYLRVHVLLQALVVDKGQILAGTCRKFSCGKELTAYNHV